MSSNELLYNERSGERTFKKKSDHLNDFMVNFSRFSRKLYYREFDITKNELVHVKIKRRSVLNIHGF